MFDVAPNEDKAGQESFRVSDLSTKSTYTVQLATKLKMGEKISMGKRSPEVTITTPLFSQFLFFINTLSLEKRPNLWINNKYFKHVISN